MSQIVIIAFYKFIELTEPENLQVQLKKFCKPLEILGTILLAQEGINGTIAGTKENIQTFIDFIRLDARFSDLEFKFSTSDFMPFQKLKVALKKEIVALHAEGLNPAKQTGVKVSPENWNALISNPEVLVIDTRNTYELDLGTFKGAVNPNTRYFRHFKEYVKNNLDPNQHKKIAMFCTGGIRCEKASSYLLKEGFETVYQLQGGILKYLEKIDAEESLWQGECFIFDDRMTIEKESILTS